MPKPKRLTAKQRLAERTFEIAREARRKRVAASQKANEARRLAREAGKP